MLLLIGSILIAVLQLSASLLISRRLAVGWLISLGTCLLAIPYDLLTLQYGFIATSVLGFVIAFRAFRSWRNPGSSNGRTPDSDSGNRGPNP